MSEIKPAATLVLLRDGPDGPELFMAERAGSMGFAAGAMVFPGGKVDASDRALAANGTLAPGFAALDPDDAAARIAAIRETFEEAGVLLSSGPAIASADRADWSTRLVAHEIDFAAMLTATGHRLDPTLLTPFARWRPPAGLERARFDTRFYLARMPAGEDAVHDGSESVTSHWIRPADALARADAGETAIIFPTRRNLERLALHDTIVALIDAARATPVRLIEPWIEDRGGGHHLCIPEDLGYPVTSERLASVRRG